jgi:CheY-like chemotaxis protein
MALRIVLADDEVQIRSFVKAVLKGSEYSIHEAGDGYEALEVIQPLESARTS